MNSLLALPALALVIIFWLEGVWPHYKDRRGRIRHAGPNILIALGDGLITLGFLTQASKINAYGILPRLQLSRWLGIIVAFVLLDLWMYFWHRANHRVPWLWLIHRAHHNDVQMDSTTALRFHPLEIAISSLLNLGVIAFFGMEMDRLIVYSLVFQPAIFFHHSNVALPQAWDQRLRCLIITPDMHRVHHSIEPDETNSNYGSVFSFWDRMFATYGKRRETQTITLGLKTFRERKWQGVRGFLQVPFTPVP